MFGRSLPAIAAPAIVAILGTAGAIRSSAQTVGGITLTNDLGSVPSRNDVQLQPLAGAVATVSAATAVAAAEEMWQFSDASLAATGVVRAKVTVAGSSNITNFPALLVVAHIVTPKPGPVQGTYGEMVTVVDASSGQAAISYPADPSPGT